MPRLASLRIPGKQDLNFAILSKNWGLSQKTKRPFVAIKTRTRESTSPWRHLICARNSKLKSK